MTPRQKRFLSGAALLGMVIAGTAYWAARSHFIRRQESGPAPMADPQAAVAGSVEPAQPMPPSSGAAPPDVQLTDDEQRAIGLQTAPVERRTLSREILAVGRVEEAETGLAAISARIGGRIDKLFVEATGQSVQRGQALALIYSPDLVITAEEYKLALENRRRLEAGALPQAITQADELVAAGRRRMELWGVTAKQIEEAASAKEPKIHITIYSPASGIVTERKVVEGQYVKEGDLLYTVSDLGAVWVKADLYESDMPSVRIGHSVEVTTEALPGAKLRGRVSFIDPMVNPQTRTVAVRIPIANPGLRLRPGMYANARFRASSQDKMPAVPRSAVLDTGTRKVVYVAQGGGNFEAREVQLGPPDEEYYPVISGLKEGERVVTRGSFLIDSQTRITGGMTGLFGGSTEFAREPKPASSGAAPGVGSGYKITFQTLPDPPKGAADNTFRVSVTDSSGKPVSDAQVRVNLVMPAMPSMGMPEMRSSADLSWKGDHYEGTGSISMGGPWNVTVEVSRGGQAVASHRTRLSARP